MFAAAYRARRAGDGARRHRLRHLHEHPNCDGAALGAASYRDFLIFARTVERLEGGVLLNFGSAIMGPEVYLKALAMARNVAHAGGPSDPAIHDGCVRHRADPRRHPPRIAEDRSRLLLPPAQDDAGAHGRRRRRELLFCGEHRATLPALRRAVIEAAGMNVAPILEGIQRLRVLVVGDICLDRWCSYDPALAEPSRETGIPRIGSCAH